MESKTERDSNSLEESIWQCQSLNAYRLATISVAKDKKTSTAQGIEKTSWRCQPRWHPRALGVWPVRKKPHPLKNFLPRSLVIQSKRTGNWESESGRGLGEQHESKWQRTQLMRQFRCDVSLTLISQKQKTEKGQNVEKKLLCTKMRLRGVNERK